MCGWPCSTLGEVPSCLCTLSTDGPISYWLNGYRPKGEEYCDPLEQYEGMPYYGYMLNPANPSMYTLSPFVSPPKPVPENVMPHMGLHKRKAQEQAAAREQAELEQAAIADAEAREKAKDEERLERQRKLAAKEKRLAAAASPTLPAPKVRKQAPLPKSSQPSAKPAEPSAKSASTTTKTGPASKPAEPNANSASTATTTKQAPLPKAYQVPRLVPKKTLSGTEAKK